MKTLMIKINNSISNLIKTLLKKHIAKKWISQFSSTIPMKTLIIEINNKTCEMGPQKKQTPGGNHWQFIFINRGLNPLFHHPVLLLIPSYHN